MLHQMVLARQFHKPAESNIRNEGDKEVDEGTERLNHEYQTLIDEMKRQISALELENEKSM